MKALVISGGGSKGAFAGGVAQYLMQEQDKEYDLFVGSSTGSLLTPLLAVSAIDRAKAAFTGVNQSNIFDNCPFVIKRKNGINSIGIHHFNVLKNFIRGRKTFGESNNLRKLIEQKFLLQDYELIKDSKKDVIITVSNLSANKVEYKSLQESHYEDFLDWIWISCNYVPFMTLATKNGCEYADGGLGCIIPIERAVKMGATEIDAILLDTEFPQINRIQTRNPFDAMNAIFGFMADRIQYQNVKIGKLVTEHENVKMTLFHTPTVLTTNSLIFDRVKMEEWWESGWLFARQNFAKKTIKQ